MSFSQLGLSRQLVQALQEQGIFDPFPIQKAVIPPILAGKDVLGISPTGSGKTAGFILPILEARQKLDYKNARSTPVLILVPTRELALQIEEVVKSCTPRLARNIRSMSVYGGVSINPQMKNMMGVELLIATPGRLLDLLDHNALSLAQLETLVIDEADKMFQLGFEKELLAILKLVPDTAQQIMFSATLNDHVDQIKKSRKGDFQTIHIQQEDQNIDAIEQLAYLLGPEKKGPFLRDLLKQKPLQQVLLFVSSTRTADNLLFKLKKHGIKALTLHSGKSQGARVEALRLFKTGQIQLLITTDLLARGIHIDELPLVINYELPRSPLDYIHRIGRTGRAQHKGTAISLITPDELHHFQVIQKKMKRQVPIIRYEDVNFKSPASL